MTDSKTKKYKTYYEVLEEIGHEEMSKLMKNDMDHVYENFVEIWRLFSALKEEQISTDKRLQYLELVLGSSISDPNKFPLSFKELQDNIAKQKKYLLVKEQKNDT